MKCYAELKDDKFTFYVEDVPKEYEDVVIAAYMKKVEDRFIKEYEMSEYIEPNLLKANFSRLTERMITQRGENWDKALVFWIDTAKKHGIEWYLRGSATDAIRGAKLTPHDLDIVVHTRDFFKIKDYVIEPFIDNHGTWVVRYFGRLCLEGVMVDVDADEKENAENYSLQYEVVQWKGYTILMEPFENRYKTEMLRGRTDRIEKLNELKGLI
ncbi:MAG: hypothetical protein K0R34_206 [Herbinix sp.]|jgi:hypothetical protein|nr:hypothetical protein [Herbinix sp.]